MLLPQMLLLLPHAAASGAAATASCYCLKDAAAAALGLQRNCKHAMKKGVTRVTQAATLQLNQAKEGHNQNEKGAVRDKTTPLCACHAHSVCSQTF
jgi:hypothetical protein